METQKTTRNGLPPRVAGTSPDRSSLGSLAQPGPLKLRQHIFNADFEELGLKLTQFRYRCGAMGYDLSSASRAILQSNRLNPIPS
jgi:hypothetical protein